MNVFISDRGAERIATEPGLRAESDDLDAHFSHGADDGAILPATGAGSGPSSLGLSPGDRDGNHRRAAEELKRREELAETLKSVGGGSAWRDSCGWQEVQGEKPRFFRDTRTRRFIEESPVTEAEFMGLAIAKAREGIAAGQSPFGSIIVRDGRAVAATHNTVWRDTDPTAHAEVNCLRAAARSLATIDLRGCTLFSTCEPCPMCLSAIHWAKVDRVAFGATIADAAGAGFAELFVDAKVLAELGRSPLRVEGGLLREECARLFQEWKDAGLGGAY